MVPPARMLQTSNLYGSALNSPHEGRTGEPNVATGGTQYSAVTSCNMRLPREGSWQRQYKSTRPRLV